MTMCYRQRDSRSSPYYQCVEDHFEIFEQTYDEAFEKRHGFFRPYLRHVIYRYLDCGDLHNGFARVKCADCGHEYLLAFSCKRGHFCPSCHQKRVVEFGEWLCGHVLKTVPHRHVVLSIPKMLRKYFLYDRSLLSELSRCAWESLKTLLEHAVPQDDAVPGAVIAIQTFGDFLGFNPHCHILCTNGCYEVDPLTCPKCHGPMRIISFIQDQEVVEKILKHLGLWLTKPKVPPRANAPPRQLEIDYSDSQIPFSEEPFQADPDYPIDAYLS